jgi:hypothetical protein
VASVGTATLSQLSFADLDTQVDTVSGDELPPTQRASQGGSLGSSDLRNDTGTHDEDASPVTSVPTSVVGSGVVDQKGTKTTPKVTESEELKRERSQWTFAKRPLVHGMAKAQRREKKRKEERDLALDLADQYRTDKVDTPAKLEHVARMMDGPYSLFHARPMANTDAAVRQYPRSASNPIVQHRPECSSCDGNSAAGAGDGGDLCDGATP